MPRRAKTEERWRSTSSPYGYIEPRPLKGRNRIAVMRHRSRRRTTGLLWRKENKEQCLVMLHEWMQGKDVVQSQEEQAAPMTLEQMIDQWKDCTRWRNMKKTRQATYEQAFTNYFPNNVPADQQLIRQMIQQEDKRLDEKGLAPGSRRVWLWTIHTFLKDCMAEGWLEEDPMTRFTLPSDTKSKDIITIFEWEETQSVIDYAYTLPESTQRSVQVKNLLTPLAYNVARRMGARISEQMKKLTWQNMYPDRFVLHRKGGKIVELEWEYFPFCYELFEEVRAILQRFGYPTEGNAKVWGPLGDAEIRKRWNAHAAKAGVEQATRNRRRRARTWHTLRKTAIWLMDEMYEYDEPTMTRLCGNTVKVRDKHYRGERSDVDIRRRYDRARRRKMAATPRRTP